MDPRERERFEALVTAAVDGELDEAGWRELEEIFSRRPDLRREMEDQRKIKEVVGTMRFIQPAEEHWDRFKRMVLHRLERSVGWSFFVIGVGILLGYGGYVALMALLTAEDVDLWVKAGTLLTLLGTAVLLVSIIRERLFLRRRERYDEVER